MTAISFNIEAATREQRGDRILLEVGRVAPDHYLIDKCLHAGADIECRDDDGSTALMRAVKRDHTGIALMLISAGANLGVTDHLDNTPLMYADQNGNLQILKELRLRNAPRRAMSGITAEKWDEHMDHIDEKIAAMDATEKTFRVPKQLILKAK